MNNVDFIVDEQLRDSLISDLQELDRSLEVGNLKAAHVIAGSIVEATLIDHLMTTNIVDTPTGMKLDLAGAITKCRERGIISERTADMSSVIRSYRNLIHPGRSIRLNERITPETARVARSLVGIVLDEVSTVRTKNYGPTAEQILAKLERDAQVQVIIPHLLKSANKRELERLLLKVLPAAERRLNNDFESPAHLQEAVAVCFRTALQLVDHEVQKKVAGRFASIIRSETDELIASYGQLFFRAHELALVSPEDKSLVKDYLFGRMAGGLTAPILAMLEGIGMQLKKEDAVKFIDPLSAVTVSDGAVFTIGDGRTA